MSQPFYKSIQECVVKLIPPSELDWGTGFFVAEGEILTCAHVVADYENQPISVQWKGKDFSKAEVIKLIPEPVDLALLKYKLSPSEKAPPCVILDREFQPFHRLYIYGYPDDFPQGAGVTVQSEGDATDQSVRLIKFQAGQIRPGHSGAPVLNEETGKVCGIVSDTRGRSTDLGGLAISITEAIKHFPNLQSNNKLFHDFVCPKLFSETEVISEFNRFSGRNELLRQLFEELDKGSNRSLIGSARVGKTWLLQQVCQHWNTKMQQSIDGCLFLDMQIIEDGKIFFEVLCEEIGINPSFKKHQIVRALKNKRFILCLDEIDILTDENRFEESDRRFLRALSDGADKPFSLVIASQHPLRELFPDSPTHSSPLADICEPIYVNALTLDQAKAFIEACRIRLTEIQIRQVWQESKGKPRELIHKVVKIYESGI